MDLGCAQIPGSSLLREVSDACEIMTVMTVMMVTVMMMAVRMMAVMMMAVMILFMNVLYATASKSRYFTKESVYQNNINVTKR